MDEKRKRGRPAGAMNKLSQEAVNLAKQTGKLPHEILLEIARGNPICVLRMEEGSLKPVYVMTDPAQVLDAAKAAAPYFAPKISTVEVIAGVSDHELDRIIALAAAEAGISLGTSGEGEEAEEEEPTERSSRTGRRQLRE